MPDWETEAINDLLAVLIQLRSKSEAKKFFRDLFTEAELHEFSMRWKVAQLLDAGVSYVQIEDETGLSSTTIARISKWLQDGEGGYRLMLRRLKD